MGDESREKVSWRGSREKTVHSFLIRKAEEMQGGRKS